MGVKQARCIFNSAFQCAKAPAISTNGDECNTQQTHRTDLRQRPTEAIAGKQGDAIDPTALEGLSGKSYAIPNKRNIS